MAKPLVSGINLVYLVVSDVGRSLAFYGELLGLPLEQEDQDWAEARLPGGLRFALHGAWEGAEPQVPGTISINFQTADLEGAVERLRGAGVRVGEIHREAYGAFCTVYDPDGYGVELFQPPGG